MYNNYECNVNLLVSILIFSIVVTIILGTISGYGFCKKEAIINGAAEYNSTTSEFQWKRK